MTQHSHHTAPTQFVEAAGVRFAYRRFGRSGGVPLVFNMHFIGTMDHWDPLVTDGLAASAIGKWGAPRAGAFDYLRDAHPTLEINGSNDVISIRIPITGRSTSIPRYSSLT
jgi:hypothetical protein